VVGQALTAARRLIERGVPRTGKPGAARVRETHDVPADAQAMGAS
jgi:hypothetical protein